ncbi:MAG: galactose ABC transporter substrate-binding protein [Erysipelotrichaceae bacterium]
MKKLLSVLLAATLLTFGLVGCSKGNEAPAKSDVNAAVFYYNFADVYITSVRASVDKLLTEAGIKFQNLDGQNNQANQLEQVKTAITNGANLLIVNIVETSSPDAAQNVVNAAKEKNIPVIFFNREVSDDVVKSYENCAFVGTDAPEAGHKQGALIAEQLLADYDKYDLNKDGKISYVMFKGQEGNAEAEFRTQFAVEDADAALVKGGKAKLEFYDAKNTKKYLVDQNGAWSSQAANDYMTTILAEYTEANKNMVELVIANNDGMAEGAISALQTAGYNKGEGKMIPVYGVDAVDSAKALIDAGKMSGTIKQDAEGMASTIVTLAKNVASKAKLMDNTSSFNVDKGVNKIRVPYGTYTKKA